MTRDQAIALVTRERSAVTEANAGYGEPNWNAWRQKRDEATAAVIARLEASGAVIRNDWRGTVLKLDGIRVTCTGGIGGALSNWLARASSEPAK